VQLQLFGRLFGSEKMAQSDITYVYDFVYQASAGLVLPPFAIGFATCTYSSASAFSKFSLQLPVLS